MRRPKSPPTEHTCHLWLTWLPGPKKWVLTWSWPSDSRTLYGWRFVDTDVPIEEDTAELLANAVALEMERWLF